MLCPTPAGFWTCLSQDSGNHVYHRGAYEESTLDIIRKLLRLRDYFVEVEASIGLMSLTASGAVGDKRRALAFELTARRFSQIKLAIEANQISNIVAFQLCLGSSAQEIMIHHNPVSLSMIGEGSKIHTERVDDKRLDTVIEQQKVSEIQRIKIDVEGFEFEVLNGATELLTSSSALAICIEYGVYNDHRACPLTHLLQLNKRYKLHQLKKQTLLPLH